MTEAEWLAADDRDAVSAMLWSRLTHGVRRRRLFLSACARRVLRFLPGDLFVPALDANDAYADGRLEWAAVRPIRDAMVAASHGIGAITDSIGHATRAIRDVTERQKAAVPALDHIYYALSQSTSSAVEQADLIRAEEAVQAQLIRDIFGNPFRPVAFDPAWFTCTVTALAAGIYADRAFDRLPVLADALEEAGCDHTDVLTHCRDDGPHVRGCWVVDAVLGKV